MKQKNLTNSGFILLEAVVGISILMLMAGLVLQGVMYMHKSSIILHDRHKALCAVLHAIEYAKSNTSIHEAIQGASSVPISPCIPYTHPSVSWHSVTVRNGSESITFYYAGCTV